MALLDDVVVSARPGDALEIRHDGAVVKAAEAPVTHAFVAGGEDTLPPLFTPLAAGLIPNPSVWGACRGGDAADATGDCPLPPAEGPGSWDGQTYWSTGAMVPGDTREVLLSDATPHGEYRLTCALHPQLAVVVRVGAKTQAPLPAPSDVAARVASVRSAAPAPAPNGTNVVVAGLSVDAPPAYVAAFSPRQIRIPAGGSVTWRAGARTPADVVFGAAGDDLSLSHTGPAEGRPQGDPAAWDGRGMLRSGFLSADPDAAATAAEWTVTFTRPGTYAYASRFGDDMRGEVIVEEAP